MTSGNVRVKQEEKVSLDETGEMNAQGMEDWKKRGKSDNIVNVK